MFPKNPMLFLCSPPSLLLLLLLCPFTLVNGIRVFFDGDGSFLSFSEKVVKVGETYGELPRVNKTGFNLEGWYSEKAGGDRIEETTVVTQRYDHYVYARLKPKVITVIFNPMGGVVDTISKEVSHKELYGPLPTPKREMNNFIEWRTNSDAVVNENTVVTLLVDHILYAAWESNTVSFVIGNGTVLEIVFRYDEEIAYPTEPRRDGYVFNGWDKNITKANGMDVTITALWSEKGETKKSKGNAATIALVVVFIVILVVIVVLLVKFLFHMLNKGTMKYEKREISYESDEEDSDVRASGTHQALLDTEEGYNRHQRGYKRGSRESGDDDGDDDDGKGERSYDRKGGERGRKYKYNRSRNYDRKGGKDYDRDGDNEDNRSDDDDDEE